MQEKEEGGRERVREGGGRGQEASGESRVGMDVGRKEEGRERKIKNIKQGPG